MIKYKYKSSQLNVIETCAAIARNKIALESEVERTWKNGEFHDVPMHERIDFITLKMLFSSLKFYEKDAEISENFKKNTDFYGCLEWAEKFIEAHKEKIAEMPKSKTKKQTI